MAYSLRWYLTLGSTILIFSTLGVQFSIILPTIWGYMRGRFGAEQWLYSLSISATSLTNLCAGPVLGFIYDKTHACKLLVLSVIASAATGSFLYFAATSPYMVLGGRLLQGLGVASGTVLSGELSRITTKEERTPICSMLMAFSQVGYVMGPGFNIFLAYLDFQTGPFKVDKYTSPGVSSCNLFMTMLWLVNGLVFTFCYFHWPTAEEQDRRPVINTSHRSVINNGRDEMYMNGLTEDDDDSSVDDNESGLTSDVRSESDRYDQVLEITGVNRVASIVHYAHHSDTSETSAVLNQQVSGTLQGSSSDNSATEDGPSDRAVHESCCHWLCSASRHMCKRLLGGFSMLVWEEIVLLLYVFFVMLFAEMAVEVSFTPIAEKNLHWNEIPVIAFFSVVGVLVILVSIIVSLLSKKVSDRWMILVGVVAELLACIWLLGWFYAEREGILVMPQFVIGTTIVLLTEVISLGCGMSLYSKLLRPEIQGLGHGVRRSLVSIGSTMGSLWAAISLQLDSKNVLYGVPIGILLLAILLLGISFRKLKE